MTDMSQDAGFIGYRRRIELVPYEGGMQAAMEDDFHRFTLKLAFDGDRISALDGTTERVPWSPCPGALPYLIDALVGRTVDEVQAMARDTDHCTHLLDLAVLAAAHAEDRKPASFDMSVSDAVEGRREARLYRDGVLALAWTFEGDLIIAPAAFAGLKLRNLRKWGAGMSPQRLETALLLRRAILISGGRTVKADAPFDVAAHRVRRAGVCFTYTGDRLQDTVRKPDWRIDFSDRPQALLATWPPSQRA